MSGSCLVSIALLCVTSAPYEFAQKMRKAKGFIVQTAEKAWSPVLEVTGGHQPWNLRKGDARGPCLSSCLEPTLSKAGDVILSCAVGKSSWCRWSLHWRCENTPCWPSEAHPQDPWLPQNADPVHKIKMSCLAWCLHDA